MNKGVSSEYFIEDVTFDGNIERALEKHIIEGKAHSFRYVVKCLRIGRSTFRFLYEKSTYWEASMDTAQGLEFIVHPWQKLYLRDVSGLSGLAGEVKTVVLLEGDLSSYMAVGDGFELLNEEGYPFVEGVIESKTVTTLENADWRLVHSILCAPSFVPVNKRQLRQHLSSVYDTDVDSSDVLAFIRLRVSRDYGTPLRRQGDKFLSWFHKLMDVFLHGRMAD